MDKSSVLWYACSMNTPRSNSIDCPDCGERKPLGPYSASRCGDCERERRRLHAKELYRRNVEARGGAIADRGEYTCRDCGGRFPRTAGYHVRCAECANKRGKDSYVPNSCAIRRHASGCPICGATDSEIPRRPGYDDDKGRYHVDHIVPRVRGGGAGRDNIRVICWQCNFAKNGYVDVDDLVGEFVRAVRKRQAP